MQATRKILIVLVVAATSTLLALGTALVASAATPPTSTTTGTQVQYFSSSHKLRVCDTLSDGDSPYAWWNPGTSHAQPTNRDEPQIGAGNCKDYGVRTDSTRKVSFQACRDVRYAPDNCGSWVTTNY